VYCQLEHLWDCHPGRIRHALTELPETLDKTYERTLRGINKADWELAHRLFQCVAFASRPLRVEELAEFLAFDFKAGPIAKFQEDWRLEDPVDAVLSRCSALLVLVNVDGSQVIQFSHFSVKEYLTSDRLAEASDKTLRQFSISMTPAHTLIAQACLGTLLHLDTDITRDKLTKYPLALYSAQHWVKHALFENVSQNVEDGMKELFDPRKRHVATWIWIFDPRNPTGNSKRAEWPTPPGGTPLHYAAVCGLDRIVKFLAVEHSQDVNSPHFDDGWSPLHLASGYGHVQVARVLIEQGADVTTRTVQGRTPLHVASRRGHVDVAGFLVEHGANVIALDNGGNTPLHEAAMRGHVDMSRFLLQQGTDATVQNNAGWSPLLNVSTYGYPELARLLIELGADISAQAKDQKSPLHEASVFGHLALVRMFIEHGADMTACYKDGRTPLHFASSYGYLEIVRVLVKHGANAAAQAVNGQSPLHVAASYGHVEIACILVEHGADVNARTAKGWTPLHGAAHCGDVQVARFLIERGASAASGSDDGTPRDVASKKGHVEFVRFLDRHGAGASTQSEDKRSPVSSATARNKTGWSPLHVAAAQGDVEVVRALVECGVDTTALADDGRTPLHVAAEAGHVEVVRFLANHGKYGPRQGIRLLCYLVAFCIFVDLYLRFV
jgi:ankyrin repeat protein